MLHSSFGAGHKVRLICGNVLKFRVTLSLYLRRKRHKSERLRARLMVLEASGRTIFSHAYQPSKKDLSVSQLETDMRRTSLWVFGIGAHLLEPKRFLSIADP